MSEAVFKVVMRGYDRAEVDRYIEKLEADAQNRSDEQVAQIESLTKEAKELNTRLTEGESLRGEMQGAMSGAQDFINAQATKLKIAERELEESKKKNALYLDKQDALTKLLADAQIKCGKLVEEAEEHSRRIMAEAERERAELLEKARQSAAHIVSESKKDADTVQAALRERFSTITDTVVAIRQLTKQVNACCDAADQMIAEPDSFFYSELPDEETVSV